MPAAGTAHDGPAECRQAPGTVAIPWTACRHPNTRTPSLNHVRSPEMTQPYLHRFCDFRHVWQNTSAMYDWWYTAPTLQHQRCVVITPRYHSGGIKRAVIWPSVRPSDRLSHAPIQRTVPFRAYMATIGKSMLEVELTGQRDGHKATISGRSVLESENQAK